MLRAAIALIAVGSASCFSPAPSAPLLRGAQRGVDASSAVGRSPLTLTMTSDGPSPVSRRSLLLGASAASVLLLDTRRASAVKDFTPPPAPAYIPSGGESYSVPLPADYKGPVPKPSMKAEEAIDIVVNAMRNNDSPSPNNGLKTAIAFTSSQNPLASAPMDKFRSLMDGSYYKILFGGYDKSESKVFESFGNGKCTVHTTLTASKQAFLDKNFKEKYIECKGGDDKSCTATVVWKMTKSEGTNGNWLFDTVFFAPVGGGY